MMIITFSWTITSRRWYGFDCALTPLTYCYWCALGCIGVPMYQGGMESWAGH